MTLIDYSRVLSKKEIDREDGLSLDIPSSPYRPATSIMSSRRDSLVSSTNFSIASSFGTAGSSTPSSYASFPDINMSNMTSDASLSGSLCMSSSTVDYNMPFISPHYVPQEQLYPWDDNSAADGLGMHLCIHLCENDLQSQQCLYDAENAVPQEDLSLPSKSISLDLEPLCDNIIAPRQIFNSIHAATLLSSSVDQSSPDQKAYIREPLLRNLDQIVNPRLSTAYSPSKKPRKHCSTKTDVKKEKSNLLSQGQATTESKIIIEDPHVTRAGKHDCSWIYDDGKICGTDLGRRFERKEHKTRHLKSHIESSLKEIEQNTSNVSYWARLLPHLRTAVATGPTKKNDIIAELAKRRIGNVLALRKHILKEVLEEIYDIFPYEVLHSDPYYTTVYIDPPNGTLCLKCGKSFSRPDNLRQHIVKCHIEHTSSGRKELERAKRCYKGDVQDDLPLRELLNWGEIVEYGWTELAEICCQKQEQQSDALGLVKTNSPSKRKSNSCMRGRKAAKRASSSSPSSSPSSAAEPDELMTCHYGGQPDLYEHHNSLASFDEQWVVLDSLNH